MTAVSRPDKQAVRDWLKQQLVERKALPTPEEVRRSLGWFLIDGNKPVECAR
jgi:hypothetical protein